MTSVLIRQRPNERGKELSSVSGYRGYGTELPLCLLHLSHDFNFQSPLPNQTNEVKSDFYDLEYFISLEYRYLSGALAGRTNNILSVIRKKLKNYHASHINEMSADQLKEILSGFEFINRRIYYSQGTN